MSNSVLVVVSEPNLCNQLSSALIGDDFRVSGALDYFQALVELEEFQPDIILMDEELPLVDGWEACYQIHWALGIPVIVLGRIIGDEVWVEVIQAGAEFYLRKPFSYSELVARIRAVLRRYNENKLMYQVTS